MKGQDTKIRRKVDFVSVGAMTPEKRWDIYPEITSEASEALKAFPPLLRQVLFNRDYKTDEAARVFLKASTNFDTNPMLMKGMPEAVERICFALEHGEPIAIYGDYDVDGVTATALMVESLRTLGAQVQGYIPNRFDEGYGLNPDALDHLKQDGVKLVITVDCGIRSPGEAQHAKDIGLDMIISDHHHPAEGVLPPAVAVINPKQEGDTYSDKNLAGVGIAYKIAEALSGLRPGMLNLDSLLDLVALGTVADLAPLKGENRRLVRRGLRQMRLGQRQGLFSLARIANLDLAKVNAGNIGFVLGPRLNASGRLKSALASFELLTTTNVLVAGQLSQLLDTQNRERQELTRKMQIEAETIAMTDDPEAFLLFAAHEEFNSGVVGLAASRLSETHYRPAAVGSRGPEETRASCRSIPEFHITAALDECKDLLVRHGGHAAAAGFTVKNANLPELVRRLKVIARRELSTKDLRPTLKADAEVPLTQMRPDLVETLSYLEPTGYGNPDAVFVSRGVKIRYARTVGADGKHLKLLLEDESGYNHDAIGFRLGHLQPELNGRADILYTYEINEFNGRVSYQLNLKDVKPSGKAG